MPDKPHRKKRVTQETFDKIKQLRQANLDIKQVATFMGVSATTVGRTEEVETFPEYKVYLAKKKAEWLKNKPGYVPEPSDEPQDGFDSPDPEEDPELEQPAPSIAVSLARIADNLERLAEAWENTPTKKSIFNR